MKLTMFTPGLWVLIAALNLFGCSSGQSASADNDIQILSPGTTTDFTFETSGIVLSGQFDTPTTGQADALIIFVHGYGQTNIRAWNSFGDLRQQFNEKGIATAVWDKPGQGRSGGSFDINQSVYESARELTDAVRHFRDVDAPGAQKIGVWGISRAGWIVPIAISVAPEIEFWISVSGTTAEDNSAYLVLSNLPYEGGSPELADQLAEEWRNGCEIFRTGGSFEQYQAATEQLRANAYIKQIRGDWQTQSQYEAQQGTCQAGRCARVDDDMCSYVFIEDFDTMLSSLNVDVLAIFGEKDLNVDWRKTQTFYRDTIGQNANATLTLQSFADADHNLNIAETGSLREMQSMTAPVKAEGYYETTLNWLDEFVLAAEPED